MPTAKLVLTGDAKIHAVDRAILKVLVGGGHLGMGAVVRLGEVFCAVERNLYITTKDFNASVARLAAAGLIRKWTSGITAEPNGEIWCKNDFNE